MLTPHKGAWGWALVKAFVLAEGIPCSEPNAAAAAGAIMDIFTWTPWISTGVAGYHHVSSEVRVLWRPLHGSVLTSHPAHSERFIFKPKLPISFLQAHDHPVTSSPARESVWPYSGPIALQTRAYCGLPGLSTVQGHGQAAALHSSSCPAVASSSSGPPDNQAWVFVPSLICL